MNHDTENPNELADPALEPLPEFQSPWTNLKDSLERVGPTILSPRMIVDFAPYIHKAIGIPAVEVTKIGLFAALIDWALGYGFSRYELSSNQSYYEEGVLYLTPIDYQRYLNARATIKEPSSAKST